MERFLQRYDSIAVKKPFFIPLRKSLQDLIIRITCNCKNEKTPQRRGLANIKKANGRK